MVYFFYISILKAGKLLTKAEQTTKFIIKKVAPIFNQKGYSATSMADITKATGLTKGAIYGNFKNKETLAVEAFNKNVNDLLIRIAAHQKRSKSPLQKLFLIPDFYRNYYEYSKKLGGCPILNVGVDSKNQETALLEQVRIIIEKTQNNISTLVDWGKSIGEIKENVNSKSFAKRLYSRIQGAIFMAYTMDDPDYLIEAMDEIDSLIKTELID